jgi:hypothetical protein
MQLSRELSMQLSTELSKELSSYRYQYSLHTSESERDALIVRPTQSFIVLS